MNETEGKETAGGTEKAPVTEPAGTETEEPKEVDPRPAIVSAQLEKAILVPNVSVNMNVQYSVYGRSDGQRATFVLPAGEEYVKTKFTAAGDARYANLVIPKGAVKLTVTVDGFVQDGVAWNGGGAAIGRAGEYAPLYDSGWLNFGAMKAGGTYGSEGLVRCVESSENHIVYELDVSHFGQDDLLWNCTFDTKGKIVDLSAVHIGLEVEFGEEKEAGNALTKLGSVGMGSYSTQGGAVYGDTLFQFHDKLGEVRVYDLKEKILLYTAKMSPTATYHCNNASFGVEFAEVGDEFPLLYVSAENIAEHKVVAFRVKRAGDKFAFVPVQTITFPSVEEGGYYYPNASVDAEAGKLYYQGWPKDSWKKEEYRTSDTLKLIEYDLPKLSEGDVKLPLGQAVDMPLKTATQGFRVENGILYQVYGLNASDNFLSVIDCRTGRELFNETLFTLGGIGTEPENVCRWGDSFVIVLLGGEIYRLDPSVFEK